LKFIATLLAVLAAALLCSCGREPQPGRALDEARTAGRNAASFPHTDGDYFHAMDGGLALSPGQVRGRNMWLLWNGGNDRFWNQLAQDTSGTFDLLKVISSHPALGYSRGNRWKSLGLINEPCFTGPTGPDKARFGLWLDARSSNCAPDPFEDESHYPGVAIGARGKPLGNGTTLPVGSYYGYATGILGLRLFPNPDFDARAAQAWDPERYYTDPAYYNRPDLVRPYRVGMTCGFCHVGPSPIHPPADPEAPTFAELSSTVGAQYLRADRLLSVNSSQPDGPRSFLSQLLGTYRPGTLDTSLLASDNINNPRAVNAMYDFRSRLELAKQLWHEKLAGAELSNRQLEDFSKKDGIVPAPHLLADGADSVGLPGALSRFYLSIGLFSEEGLTHFNPLVGGKSPTPFEIPVARQNSVYWQATEAGIPDTVLFLLAAAQPDRLQDAPGGSQYLSADARTLARGKEVFADTCARCHSSKGPVPPENLNLDAERCAASLYVDCFKRYWSWTQTDDFRKQMRAIVAAPDFLAGNYLSTDARIPVTLLRTNLCSALATNALSRNLWDNFSSHSYKQLPTVGNVTLYNPLTGEPAVYEMPAGGRGFTRVPSLISVWSTAPFLLNNSVGPFDSDPSVAARIKVFEASMEQLLWPEKRARDPVLGNRIPGLIERTTQRSQLTIPARLVPEPLGALRNDAHRWLPRFLDSGGDIELGPFPAGMPLGLLANLQLRADGETTTVQAAHQRDLDRLLPDLRADLSRAAGVSDDDLAGELANLADPMLRLSACPDLIVNRGHYFGTAQFNDQDGLTRDEQAFGKEVGLSDDDKRALIALLKTF
jgi:hypothetical protein